MQKDNIYFGEKGLTATSANHVANLAKEYYQGLETYLNGIKFYSERVSIIGSAIDTVLSQGETSVDKIPECLKQIAEMKSLIAWLREAIKAKENLIKELNYSNVKDWCEEQGVEYPAYPEDPGYMDENDYLATLTVKERNRYFELQAHCAVIGKYIHNNGHLADERATLKMRTSHPTRVSGEGNQMVIYRYTPSIEKDKVDDLFFELQNQHRSMQAELNGMKHKMDIAINNDIMEKRTAYNIAYDKACEEIHKVKQQHKEWLQKESTRVQELKIIIPKDLLDAYSKIEALGKK